MPIAVPAKPLSKSETPDFRVSETRTRLGKRPQEGVADKPTIHLVAERAQVAISTVSRVLNGGSASQVARDRVLQVVRELGYAPSVAAQSLVARKAGAIGLVVNSSQNPWFSQILAGVEEVLASSRQSVLLASMMLTGQYDPSAPFAWIRERRVDGLIFARYARRNRPLFKAAMQARLPVALIAPEMPAPVNFLARCDNLGAGRLAAEHLADLGHRRIAFAGGPRDSIDMRLRLKGLAEGLSTRGLKLRDRDIWFGSSFAPETGFDYAKKVAAERPKERPTAVVLGNDAMALGFMRAMWQRGVRVPEEISVMGFDGIPDGALFWPALTTVVQPTQQMAARACRVILECIEQNDPDRATTVEYGVELLVRESTAPPPP